MSKVKLVGFELVSLLEDRKKLTDFLQLSGVTHLKNICNEKLKKTNTESSVEKYELLYEKAKEAVSLLEYSCSIKKSFLDSFSDYSEIDYSEYKLLCQKAEAIEVVANKICCLNKKIKGLEKEAADIEAIIGEIRPWEKLDIPLGSRSTSGTSIFIGTLKGDYSAEKISEKLSENEEFSFGLEIQVISSSPFQTCFVLMCHKSEGKKTEAALEKIGFSKPNTAVMKIPSVAIAAFEKEIKGLKEQIEKLSLEIASFAKEYENLRFLCDFCLVTIEKYRAISLSAATENVIYYEGYLPERESEELKFEIERRFRAQIEFFEPDYEDNEVPVLVKNSSFAAGVENITEMYSPVSNKDVDPNPIMSVFYYGLFGLMLSDGGYGILMIVFSLVAKLKLKVTGGAKRFADFALYCGISTTVWGAVFGGWFGDLIPTVCRTFLKIENPPELALWFNPQQDSIKMLLFSFLLGIIHLYFGLAIRFFNLCRQRKIFSAICDCVPVYVFVSGLAVVGKNFIEPVSEEATETAIKLLIAGAVLIVLTSGRSAKNVFGKLGGGLYGVYSITTGYLGDILSYSRLLALNLVTGVIAMVVNILASMPKNIFIFVLIFVVGHGVNFAINLIGAYVHTNRLQYVEFFSKFYEGGGKSFTPFKINSKYFKLKEETIND